MKPLPYADPSARVIFYAVLVAFVALELRTRVRSRLNPEGAASDRLSFAFIGLTFGAGVGAAFTLAANVHGATFRAGRWPFFIAGIVLMAAGIAIRQWAVAMLGRYFTTDVRVHAGQAVIDTGPYRWVRHPSYTGLLMTLIGIGLALGNWAALLVLIVLPAIGIVNRIRVEERALSEGIGEPYRRFAATRARLIPHVW
ncbi:MAG TPA: isoprenylcysteine carboxylmethyltransferase family protein [Solirubrobacteraceae bacterium]|jgi:protein-S-isoprenylcysteine O-methyltransferase Ste14